MITLLTLLSVAVSTVFAFDTGFSSPGKASSPGKSWTNISYSFSSNNLYAIAKKTNKQLKLSNFNIPGIPAGSTINGIEVNVEGLTSGLQANVALSYNAGTNYTTAFTTALTGTDAISTLGGPTNTWGRTWAASEFNNSNFVVKLTTTGASGTGITISVDQVQVKVYYTAPSATLTLSPVSGPYNGTASMTATLTVTADGTAIPSKNINFYIGGTGIDGSGNCTGAFVGNATTQAGTGIATLASASLSGISAGNYPYGACASFAGDATYQATSVTNTLNVVGTATTLTAAPVTGIYGDTVNLSATLTMTSDGTSVNNQWIDFYLFGNLLGSSKTNSSGVATLSNVGLIGYDAGASNDIQAIFEGDANLNPANASAVITINQRPITATAVKDTKVYDGTTSSSTVPNTSQGSLVTGDIANFTQIFDTKDVGTGKTLTPSGSVEDGNSGQNYTYTYQTVSTGVINKAVLTITANNQTKFFGGTDPAFTFQYNGFVGGDTGTDVNVAPTCTVSGPHSALGSYPIGCSGGSDNNYSFSYANGTLSVIYAHINVNINSAPQGAPGYDLAVGASTRQSYSGVNNGAVQIVSPNNAKILGAERVIYNVNGTNTSFSEMMGLPNSLLNTTYWLPWYNNVDLDTQMRFGNVSGSSATVRVYIGGVEMTSGCTSIPSLAYPYVLGNGASIRVSCAGVNNGPVKIESNVNIVAAERVIYKVNGTNTSFSEMMALPNSQLHTTYWLPWYNNVDLDTQLRFGNVSGSTATVHVYIGGVEMTGSPFTLLVGESTRVSFADINNGPVKIESNVNIVAAERVIYKVNGTNTSFSEMMALPNSQLNTTYLMPWYNNVDLDTQLRIGNVSGSTATVHVYVGGVEMTGSPFTLLVGESTRVSFAGISNGPVKIVSDVNIVAAERVIYKINGINTSFSEMMGLPNSLLDTTYWLPWYNNVDLDTQLRFGVP